jgi:ferredoxin
MKLRIDSARCTGHGRCYALAPDLVEPDDDGYGQLLVDEVPAEHEAGARKAVLGCPEQAVHLD